MVATRRIRRRSELETGSNDSPTAAEPTSVEASTSVVTTRSRSKLNSNAKVIPESYPENMRESETKIDVEEPPEPLMTPAKSKTMHLADSVGELQADGDISEAESNCSSVSGLQTFIRVTRRRQIVVPFQLETPSKNRQSKKAAPSEGNRCQEEDDLSEAESCSSSVSGARTPNIVRRTRRKQIKTNISPVCEAQSEEVSDTESWCSGVSSEPSVQFKRITRSMQLRLPEESVSQFKRKSDVVVVEEEEEEEKEKEKMSDCITGSETIVISDSEQPTKSDLDAEQASSFSSVQINEQPSPSETKDHSESVASSDPKQMSSSSPKKAGGKCTKKSPKKEMSKEKGYISVEDVKGKEGMDEDIRGLVTEQVSASTNTAVKNAEVVYDLTLEKPIEVTKNQSPIKRNTGISSHDPIILEQPHKSPRQTTPNKRKSSVESQKMDVEAPALSSVDREGEEIEVSRTSKTSSPQKSSIPSQPIEIIVSTDSDGSQEEPAAESSACPDKTKTPKKSTLSLLTSDESDESENSDIEEINTVETNDSFANTSNEHAVALGKSHGEELFVIDKTPGLDSSKAYYLEEVTLDDQRSEESSELEDNEEMFVDEDEDLINTNNKVLSFSSSIDPGLNAKHLGGLYISFDAEKQKTRSHGVVPLKEQKKDELLKNSIITPDFEKKECVPPLRESVYQLKKQRKAEREKTTGDGWFGMKAPEMTDELKNDLKALKMRTAIDPKRFYKKNDRDGLPKYFQVGTIVDTPADFYHARIPKKERKKNIVEELLADSEFRRYNKRKYQEIIAERTAMAAGKKNRKKKKFRN